MTGVTGWGGNSNAACAEDTIFQILVDEFAPGMNPRRPAPPQFDAELSSMAQTKGPRLKPHSLRACFQGHECPCSLHCLLRPKWPRLLSPRPLSASTRKNDSFSSSYACFPFFLSQFNRNTVQFSTTLCVFSINSQRPMCQIHTAHKVKPSKKYNPPDEHLREFATL